MNVNENQKSVTEIARPERRELLEMCKELAHKRSILDELERQIRNRGFAGPADIPKLVYLVFLTGMLERPVSLVIKGPSGSGKSFSLDAAIQFVPSAAYERFEGMSEKALVYLKGLNLKHRHLVIGEASGMADGDGRTLLRQLLSEGRVRYATVQSTKDGLVGSELPVLEGPTGLVMTTTATGLHPEDESRMLSVNIAESPEQIAEALMAQARGLQGKDEPLDTTAWHALFEYVRSGPRKVEIPFAGAIAKRLPLTHDRIKRDFPQFLSLLKAHALLHSCSREWINGETVVAKVDDYATVRDLINGPLSQGLEVAVPAGIRLVVEGVAKCLDINGTMPFDNGVSQGQLAELLNRDRSVISRNVKKAIDQGYLRDENPGQGREARLVVGERKLPSGTVLPDVEDLFESEPTFAQTDALVEEALAEEFA